MNVLIADDDRLVCESLKIILQTDDEIEIVGTGYSGQEAIRLFACLKPDVLLMDIRMEGMTGLEAGENILSATPDARILFLTTFADDEYIIKALRMGAKGYLLKQKFDNIAPALKAVHSGQSVFGGEIVTKLPKLLQNSQPFEYEQYGINSKEQEIIELVAKGMNNQEIAETLYLSEGTVRNYLSVILDKLELRDRTQLAVFYYNKKP
ncbi:MAG: response regulator transcription factor [Oscillospiraceae bacterium]|nr:response regulator transcription factor [Oscillospiraceae bacterium]MDD3833804.1 response regulator transcription factor [Oscillospiraceae bacterium]MDD4546528.1 response regulator transcription factor [Oscillospiraceae bacterium]